MDGVDETLVLWSLFESVGPRACVFVCKLNIHLFLVIHYTVHDFVLWLDLILVTSHVDRNGKQILVQFHSTNCYCYPGMCHNYSQGTLCNIKLIFYYTFTYVFLLFLFCIYFMDSQVCVNVLIYHRSNPSLSFTVNTGLSGIEVETYKGVNMVKITNLTQCKYLEILILLLQLKLIENPEHSVYSVLNCLFGPLWTSFLESFGKVYIHFSEC